MDIISYTLGKKAGGGTPAVLQDKEMTITTNGETEITADEGYTGLGKVDLTTNVQPDLESKSLTISTNTTTTITPTSGKDGLSSVEITTNVPQPSGKITITQNGTDIDISSYASADVSVPSQKYAPRAIKFGDSNTSVGYTGTELNYEIVNLDTSNLTSMRYMFSGLRNLTSLDLSSWDTSNVIDMGNMFWVCNNLTSLDVSSFNTLNVSYMNTMFTGCNSLTSLDLSNFNTPNLTMTSSMFTGCSSLKFLDMRNFNFNGVTSYSMMFGTSANDGPPADCEIIVKDNTAKTWITSKFNWLTNVKTVAEYEGN